MSTRRIAVSLPQDLLDEADRLASRLGTSRSGLISELLARATREARGREISEAWERVARDPDLQREQVDMSREVYQGESFGDDKW
jgi:hypothetical protein